MHQCIPFLITLAFIAFHPSAFASAPRDRNEEIILDAVDRGNLTQLKHFIGTGLDPNWTDYKGRSLLQRASYRGDLTVFDYLLDQGASIHQADPQGTTPLYMAASSGQRSVLERLIARGADVNVRDDRGVTPLYIAAKKGYEILVDLLCHKGAQTELATNEQKETPLWISAKEGHKGVLLTLLKYKADFNHADKRGISPLLMASSLGHTEIVSLLLEKGANPNQIRDNGISPLIVASYKGYLPIVQALLRYKADVRYVAPLTLGGGRALHYALQENHTALVPLLEEAIFEAEEVEKTRLNAQEEEKLHHLEGQIQKLESLLQHVIKGQPSSHQLSQETLLSLTSTQETVLQEEKQKRQALENHILSLEAQLQRLSFNQSMAESLRAQELYALKNQHALLWQEHVALQKTEGEKLYLRGHPLLNTFYTTLERTLTQLFLAYKVLESGMVQKTDTKANKVAKGIKLLGGVVPLPGINIVTGVISFAINTISNKHEEKKVSLVARLTRSVTEMEEEVENAARLLSYRYEHQIKHLTQKGATTLAECGVRRLIEYMRANQLNDHESLSNQLVQSVSIFESHQGTFPFTHKDIETTISQSSSWTDRGIFQNTGIKTKEGRLFIKESTKQDKYGYRLGTYEEARSYGYHETLTMEKK